MVDRGKVTYQLTLQSYSIASIQETHSFSNRSLYCLQLGENTYRGRILGHILEGCNQPAKVPPIQVSKRETNQLLRAHLKAHTHIYTIVTLRASFCQFNVTAPPPTLQLLNIPLHTPTCWKHFAWLPKHRQNRAWTAGHSCTQGCCTIPSYQVWLEWGKSFV